MGVGNKSGWPSPDVGTLGVDGRWPFVAGAAEVALRVGVAG